MPMILARVVCIRYKGFKQKIRLVNKYLKYGYNVEILNNEFVYAELRKE